MDKNSECEKLQCWRWKTHDESLVYFDSFVRRGGDGVFVNVFEICRTKIFGKGGGYNFGSETLRDPRGMILERGLFLKGPWGIQKFEESPGALDFPRQG